jgi:kynurenine formamidase
MLQATPPTVNEVDALLEDVSNWGRWGHDDELGTLNLLTDQTRLAASRTVMFGRAISLSRELKPRATPDNPNPLMHHMLRTGHEADAEGYASSADWMGLACHGFGVTHLDALAHVFWRGRMYNNRPASLVAATSACLANAVGVMADGLVCRGVLFDVPPAMDVDWVEPGQALTCDDLDACEQAAGVEVGPGDALFIRFGRDVRRRQRGVHEPLRAGNPGLAPECARWLRERDLLALGTDVTSDVMVPGAAPHTMPIHVTALVGMGMPLVDNADLERLAAACLALGKSDFMLTVAPLALVRATGSPVNPIAVL